MKYTVITATFNSDKTVTETFNSILNQSYMGDIEYIVVDGCSTDQTVDIIKSYQEKFQLKGISFKWISEKDNGIYDAWNKGLNIATGDWISFLGSDDIYLKNALELYNETISNLEYPKDLVYSNVDVIKNNKTIRVINGLWSWKIFRRKMNIGHVGAFHNKEYFKIHGNYDADYKIAGDYELLLRAKENLKTAKVTSTTAKMAYGGISNKLIFKAFSESIKAKYQTGKLNILLCYLDFLKEYSIYFLKKVI